MIDFPLILRIAVAMAVGFLLTILGCAILAVMVYVCVKLATYAKMEGRRRFNLDNPSTPGEPNDREESREA